MHRNPTDTLALRHQFADTFLASPHEHVRVIEDGHMYELIEEFDAELCAARKRWPSLSYDAEWAAMDRWLSERGYTDPDELEG